MKKITWILACVLAVNLLAGCDIGIMDGPGMVNENATEDLDCDETDFAIKQFGAFAILTFNRRSKKAKARKVKKVPYQISLSTIEV